MTRPPPSPEGPDGDVRAVTAADRGAWAGLRAVLWPGRDPARHAAEMDAIAAAPDVAAAMVGAGGDGGLVGLVEVSLRDDVPGCVSSPVAVVDGLYVDPGARGLGWGRRLLQVAEEWARARGCAEIVSLVDADDLGAQEFHDRLGYLELARTIRYRKDILD